MQTNISKQLFQPLFERLEKDYQKLFMDTAGHMSDEGEELRGFIRKKLRQLETVRVSLGYMEQESLDPFHHIDLRDTLRQHKLELRFARRRWKRHLVSSEKFRKIQEKRTPLPTFAA